MSARIKAASGTVRAADLIERVARTGEPVQLTRLDRRPPPTWRDGYRRAD